MARHAQRNSPKMTGMGIFFSKLGRKTAPSSRQWMAKPVKRLSFTCTMRSLPFTFAVVASDLQRSSERTVAATSQGSPKRLVIAMNTPVTMVSQWYAVPLVSLWSGELTMPARNELKLGQAGTRGSEGVPAYGT